MSSVRQVFLGSSEQKENDSLLYLFMTVNRRCEGLGEESEDVGAFRQLIYHPDIRVGESGLRDTATNFR